MSNSNRKLEGGTWVRCNGKIMQVYYIDPNHPEEAGLISKDSPKYCDQFDFCEYEESYFPVEDITILPEVDADASTIRSFFRLEKTPWELAEEGLFPFSENAFMTLTEKDLKIFSDNIYHTDEFTIDQWSYCFMLRRHVEYPRMLIETSRTLSSICRCYSN